MKPLWLVSMDDAISEHPTLEAVKSALKLRSIKTKDRNDIKVYDNSACIPVNKFEIYS